MVGSVNGVRGMFNGVSGVFKAPSTTANGIEVELDAYGRVTWTDNRPGPALFAPPAAAKGTNALFRQGMAATTAADKAKDEGCIGVRCAPYVVHVESPRQ